MSAGSGAVVAASAGTSWATAPVTLGERMSCLADHTRRVLATPETEVAKDEWDLVVFGHHGTVSFTELSQDWLRVVAKRWAAAASHGIHTTVLLRHQGGHLGRRNLH